MNPFPFLCLSLLKIWNADTNLLIQNIEWMEILIQYVTHHPAVCLHLKNQNKIIHPSGSCHVLESLACGPKWKPSLGALLSVSTVWLMPWLTCHNSPVPLICIYSFSAVSAHWFIHQHCYPSSHNQPPIHLSTFNVWTSFVLFRHPFVSHNAVCYQGPSVLFVSDCSK